MSVIMITKHNESIYDINNVVNQNVVQVKNLKEGPHTEFRKCHLEAQKKFRQNSKPFGAMGTLRNLQPDPKRFLKKKTGKPPMVLPKDMVREKCLLSSRREAVPNTDCCIRDQMDKMYHKDINFIRENVKTVLTMKPKVPERRQVLDVHGDYKIVPKHPEQVSNKIFAKIPRYLEIAIKQRQAYIEKERERSGIKVSKCTYVTRDERKTLLDGLKKNWDELQRTYQGLPILTDTIPKKQRKSQIENELRQLEKDIVLIERHPFIYVYDDEDISQ